MYFHRLQLLVKVYFGILIHEDMVNYGTSTMRLCTDEVYAEDEIVGRT